MFRVDYECNRKLNLFRYRLNLDDLGHWIFVFPVFFIVLIHTIPQIDAYSPSRDEFNSLIHAGLANDGPYSLAQIIQSVDTFSPDHVPGYYILLSLWGNLTSFDVPIARILTVFAALLSLAITYRLVRDFVAPVAGLIAVVVVASNAFYSFYYAHARMYPMSLLIAGIILWLYLRIMYRCRRVRNVDYLTLFVSVYLFCILHFFNGIFLATLGVSHVLFAPKNRRWLRTTFAVTIAVLLFAPFSLSSLEGLQSAAERKLGDTIDPRSAIMTWLNVTSNNMPQLLLLSVAGLTLDVYRSRMAAKPWFLLPAFFLIALATLAHFTSFVYEFTMRYHLASWLPLVIVVSAGLYGFYRFRKWMLLLVLIWIAAGHHFQNTGEWWQFLNLRMLVFSQPPTHVISRLARQSDPLPAVLVSSSDHLYKAFLTSPGFNPRWANLGYSPAEYFFESKDIEFGLIDDPSESVHRFATISPSIWIVFHIAEINPQEQAQIDTVMSDLDYESCRTRHMGRYATILEYYWRTSKLSKAHFCVGRPNRRHQI